MGPYIPKHVLIFALVLIGAVFVLCVLWEILEDIKLYILSKKAKEKNLREKELKENDKKCNS